MQEKTKTGLGIVKIIGDKRKQVLQLAAHSFKKGQISLIWSGYGWI